MVARRRSSACSPPTISGEESRASVYGEKTEICHPKFCRPGPWPIGPNGKSATAFHAGTDGPKASWSAYKATYS
ncbi:hypothetical protein FKM82_011247 [Ascaphus truei]